MVGYDDDDDDGGGGKGGGAGKRIGLLRKVGLLWLLDAVDNNNDDDDNNNDDDNGSTLLPDGGALRKSGMGAMEQCGATDPEDENGGEEGGGRGRDKLLLPLATRVTPDVVVSSSLSTLLSVRREGGGAGNAGLSWFGLL